ncbi:MAG: isocitrate lyase [Parcubacteria group bacterium Gr01-1014_19]|nr:MAG: isocitrate lyase [Parcubacteria group bacterium Gr01-1014_19]
MDNDYPWTSERWKGIKRNYIWKDVERIRGTLPITWTLAQVGAARLWQMLNGSIPVRALGAMTGLQASQMVKAGLKAIYVSGWQTAADANSARETYPDVSVYPVDSVPLLVDRINRALRKDDLIQKSEGKSDIDFFVPLMADAESGWGGKTNPFELMKHMIEAGAAGVHFEDQLGSEKKCGHMGGKVLVPTSQFISALLDARLAADVMGVQTVIVGRTDAEAATLMTSEIDDRDKLWILGANDADGKEMTYSEALELGLTSKWTAKGVTGSWTPLRTPEGYFRIRCGLKAAAARAIAYAPYCDMLWMETKTADLDEAREFAELVHKEHPGKLLMYNCSPSFPWTKDFAKKHGLDPTNQRDRQVLEGLFESFQDELYKMGYKFVFVTLAGYHALTYSMFKLARGYRNRAMAAFVELQDEELALEKSDGFTAVRHQREVGTGYYDEVAKINSGGQSSTLAMEGSTEERFHGHEAKEKPPVAPDPSGSPVVEGQS